MLVQDLGLCQILRVTLPVAKLDYIIDGGVD